MAKSAAAAIYHLLDFAQAKGLIDAEDRSYYLNLYLDIMGMDEPDAPECEPEAIPETATKYLEQLCDIACERGVVQDSGERRDLFSARLMGVVTPAPSQVRETFASLLVSEGPKAAMDWFYRLCRDCDYIRVDRIARNARFFENTPAGRLEITINLSKPEKDPRDIAAARSAKAAGWPKCMLCPENPGYAGRIGFPARQNHRIIPLTLDGGRWYLQYSPYLYYSEHCIVLNKAHTPMKISRATFARLCDFVDQFPHYMLGSNADLPIVGGSILSHDHFQGGCYRFPMDDAGVRIPLQSDTEGVEAYVADWPMTCVVLKSADRDKIIGLSDRILGAWRGWTDAYADILAETDAPHNTVTPILRREDGVYKMELVLRNNRTSAEHPLGIFHPHADLHHIKKENIGLIEVMGLFILPGRLLSETAALEDYLTGAKPMTDVPGGDSPLSKHWPWLCGLADEYGTSLTKEEAAAALRKGIGAKCARVLADAGVYKQTPEGDAALMRFLTSVGFKAAG